MPRTIADRGAIRGGFRDQDRGLQARRRAACERVVAEPRPAPARPWPVPAELSNPVRTSAVPCQGDVAPRLPVAALQPGGRLEDWLSALLMVVSAAGVGYALWISGVFTSDWSRFQDLVRWLMG